MMLRTPIMSAVIAVAATTSVSDSRADVVTTAVGTYDAAMNTNKVDRVASESAVNPNRVITTEAGFTQFKSDVAAAFVAGTGGVANWESPSSTARDNIFLVNYAGGERQLRIDINDNTSGGARASDASRGTPISGSHVLYPDGTGHLDLDFSQNPLTLFGLAAHRTDRSGIWTLTAHFSDGETASVSTTFDADVDDDTFFGFVAPEGVTIDRVVSSGASFLRTDDLGFIVVPEPASALLITAGALLTFWRPMRRHASEQ